MEIVSEGHTRPERMDRGGLPEAPGRPRHRVHGRRDRPRERRERLPEGDDEGVARGPLREIAGAHRSMRPRRRGHRRWLGQRGHSCAAGVEARAGRRRVRGQAAVRAAIRQGPVQGGGWEAAADVAAAGLAFMSASDGGLGLTVEQRPSGDDESGARGTVRRSRDEARDDPMAANGRRVV